MELMYYFLYNVEPFTVSAHVLPSSPFMPQCMCIASTSIKATGDDVRISALNSHIYIYLFKIKRKIIFYIFPDIYHFQYSSFVPEGIWVSL